VGSPILGGSKGASPPGRGWVRSTHSLSWGSKGPKAPGRGWVRSTHSLSWGSKGPKAPGRGWVRSTHIYTPTPTLPRGEGGIFYSGTFGPRAPDQGRRPWTPKLRGEALPLRVPKGVALSQGVWGPSVPTPLTRGRRPLEPPKYLLASCLGDLKG